MECEKSFTTNPGKVTHTYWVIGTYLSVKNASLFFSSFMSPRGTMRFYFTVHTILALIHIAVTNSRVAPIFLPCPRGCSHETRCTALGCLLCQPNFCHHLVTSPLRVLCVENCPSGYRCGNVSINDNTKRFCLT